jgi:hypothetical protein
MGIMGSILSMGPYLRWSVDGPSEIPMPYLLLHDTIPLMSRLWWPDRWDMVAVTGLLIAAALGADAVHAHASDEPEPPASKLFWLVLWSGLLIEGFAANPQTPLTASPLHPDSTEVYDRLQDEEPGALLTTPVLPYSDRARMHLWYQTRHERPMFSGLGEHLFSHRAPGYEAYIEANDLLRTFAALNNSPGTPTVIDPTAIEALIADGFVWIVVDPSAFPPPEEPKFGGNPQDSVHARYKSAITGLWGEPDITGLNMALWRIEVPSEPVILFHTSTEEL